ncbi:MAG: ROK family protein [Elusimicrobia bacterium]|nr:ROK family protein [Elusimicrobiota bacterium]
MQKTVLALDVGGTKMMSGLLRFRGSSPPKILSQAEEPTTKKNLTAAKEQIKRLLGKVAPKGRGQIHGIGAALPGPIDYKKGLMLKAPNLPGWEGFAIEPWLKKKFKLPVKIENDANAAALGEALWGAGQNKKIIFYATISTGIGTGLVIEKKLYTGFTGMALEGGHLTIDHKGRACGCGLKGCIEAYASGPSLARRAHEKWDMGRGECDPPAVLKKIEQGDKKAISLIEETGRYLGIWLGNIINLIDPEVIVLGGGITNFGQHLLRPIRKFLPLFSINPKANKIPIAIAQLRRETGLFGAAALLCDNRNHV